MKMFVIGAVTVLAVLYPDVTKAVFGKLVDTTHTVTTNALKEPIK
jgi:hypothetical protein